MFLWYFDIHCDLAETNAEPTQLIEQAQPAQAVPLGPQSVPQNIQTPSSTQIPATAPPPIQVSF